MANPALLSQTGVGRSTLWFPDFFENPFNIGVGCGTQGTVTYNIEHTFDDVQKGLITAALATAAGNAILHFAGGAVDPNFMRLGRPVFDLTTPSAISASTFVTATFDTSNVTMNQNAAGGGVLAGDLISFLTWFPNSGLTAQTGNANGNYAFPVRAISINITAGTGTVNCQLIQATSPQL